MSRFCHQINSIIKKIKAGNKSSFKDLFNATYNHLKSVAYSYAADKNDCEDILQETYLRVDKYIKIADTEKDGYNWLCKIVQNVAYDFYKIEEPTDCYSEAITASFEDSLIEKDALIAEVKKLPQADQQILYLRFWKGKTFRDIEKETGIAKSAIHQRIKKLVKILENNLK